MCAVEFYLDHFEEMNAGVVMLADNFKAIKIKDGRQAVHSAIQEAYNKIADTSLAAFKSEYQNDPDDAGEEFRVKIDPHTVIGCQSDFDRNSVCADASIVVAAVDVRKAELHYVRLASGKTVKNQICDYDVVSHGTSETTVEQAEYLILDGLRALSGFLNDTPLIDCDKTSRTIDLMLIDKGWLGSWKEDGQKKTMALLATIFSPFVFLFFIYTLYRIAIKERHRDMLWYISNTAFMTALLFSFRQRIAVEDIAPLSVIAVPLMVRTFLSSYLS